MLGFDYGYSLDDPQHADPVGGPVRRLRQRCPGDHRPVHRFGRVEVGTRQRPGDALAARLRGAGARAFERPAGTVPAALRRGQYPGRRADDAGAVFPPAAAAGAPRFPQTADRDDAQESAAAQAGGFAGRPSDGRAIFTTCSTTRRPRTACAGCCSARERCITTWSPSGARSAASARSRSFGSSSFIPGRPSSSRASRPIPDQRASGSGCRKSRKTWAPGRSWRHGCRN